MLRIIYGNQLDAHDLTYSYMRVSVTTALEPVLGILVSSLPTFPPAFKKLLGGKANHGSQIVRSGSLTRLRSNGMETSRHLPRLDSSYHLAGRSVGVMEDGLAKSNSRASLFDTEHSTSP